MFLKISLVFQYSCFQPLQTYSWYRVCVPGGDYIFLFLWGPKFFWFENLFLDQTHAESKFSEKGCQGCISVRCVYLTKSKSVLESWILANNSFYTSTAQNPLSLSAGLKRRRKYFTNYPAARLKKICSAAKLNIYFSAYPYPASFSPIQSERCTNLL